MKMSTICKCSPELEATCTRMTLLVNVGDMRGSRVSTGSPERWHRLPTMHKPGVVRYRGLPAGTCPAPPLPNCGLTRFQLDNRTERRQQAYYRVLFQVQSRDCSGCGTCPVQRSVLSPVQSPGSDQPFQAITYRSKIRYKSRYWSFVRIPGLTTRFIPHVTVQNPVRKSVLRMIAMSGVRIFAISRFNTGTKAGTDVGVIRQARPRSQLLVQHHCFLRQSFLLAFETHGFYTSTDCCVACKSGYRLVTFEATTPSDSRSVPGNLNTAIVAHPASLETQTLIFSAR